MRVTETTLQELVGGPKQFRVPLFQRTYTWKERDHAPHRVFRGRTNY
jgi:hypothetical protein